MVNKQETKQKKKIIHPLETLLKSHILDLVIYSRALRKVLNLKEVYEFNA